jgi:hypothetical protein
MGAGRNGLGWRLAGPRVQHALRTAHAARLRAGLTMWRAHLDRLHAGLEAQDGQLEQSERLQIYGTVGPASAPAPPQGTRPPAPLLSQIFERLRPGQDLEESGYPRIDVIDAGLRAGNIAPADPRYVEAAFADWLRSRAQASPPATQPAGLPPPSHELLYEIFQDLDLDDPRDVNRLGHPRVAAVNRRLPAGHADADPDDIADAFAEWCELGGEDPSEPDGGRPRSGNVYEVFPRAAQRP